MTVIDLTVERNKREAPDAEFVTVDAFGRNMYAFALEYALEGRTYTCSIFAYDFADAERHASARGGGIAVSGRIYQEIPG